MSTFFDDLRYGLRLLSGRRGSTSVAVLMLALGIGANTAIFSVINAVLLGPLPWKDPDRIVYVWETNLKLGINRGLVSPANFLDWREQSQAFEQAAAWRFLYFNLTGRDEPERVQGLLISAGFFPLLGVKAALGRTFLPEEDQPGRNKVVILSHSLWQRRFGSDPDLIGRQITVEGEPQTVVGILPPDFQFFRVLNRQLDLYQPIALDAQQTRREDRSVFVYARLKPGVSLGQARAEMAAIYRRFEQAYPAADAGWGVSLIPMPEAWVERSRPLLLLLLAAVVFVLLIACANVANLLLVRAAGRQKEMAIRVALGAKRWRLVRQLLTESLLLALLGGGAGLLAARWLTHLLNDLVPYTAVNRMGNFRLDNRVLCFTLVVSLLAGVSFGLAPALQSSEPNLNESLKEGGRGGVESRQAGQLRNLLVIVEVALSVMLLVGAGLMIKSAWRLSGIHRGFDPRHVLTMQIWLPRARYAQGRQVAGFYRQVLERVGSLPGAEEAAAVNFPPLALQYTTVPFTIGGGPPARTDEAPTALYSVISPEYFRAMRIPLLAGRQFTDQDADETHGVVIISEDLARRSWPGEDPLGKQIRPQFPQLKAFWLPESKNLPLTVVGLVGNVKREGLNDSHLPQIYLPYFQNPSSIMNLVVRTRSDPLRLADAVRREVYAVDRDQPVFDIKTMEEVVAESFAQPRIVTLLLAGFAATALLLSATGIYGVISYSVSQRTHEIGIRLALGAQPRDVLRLVVKQGLALVLIGIGAGLTAAFALTRLMAKLLFGVGATDPMTFVGVAALLAGVALLACYLPARRATKVDPMAALRYE